MKDQRKYPAHSTRIVKARPVDQEERRVFALVAIVLVLFGVLVVMVLWFFRSPILDQYEVGARAYNDQPVGAAVGFLPLTNTPRIPTETNSPPSPFPTFTSTEIPTGTIEEPTKTKALERCEPEIVYIEIPIEVIKTVEVAQAPPRDTATPRPSITPRPSSTSTVSPLVLKANHNIDMTIRNEKNAMRMKEYIISPAFVTIVLILVVIVFIFRSITKIEDELPTVEETTERLEDLDNYSRIANIPINTAQSKSSPTFEELEKIKTLIENNPKISRNAIAETVFGYSGGSAHYKNQDKITAAIELLTSSPPTVATTD